jgi:hypothetical protein
MQMALASARRSPADGLTSVRYQCQATELFPASKPQKTWDPRPYFNEYASGNVGLGHFLRVMARAVVQHVLRRLRIRGRIVLPGTRTTPRADPALGLQPGDLVRVKSRDGIAATLTPSGKNRGLWFDGDEMLPFCGTTVRVHQRVKRFIEERTGEMIELKTDALTLDGVVCSGERSLNRWFCPRALYPYWREAWLERADDGPTQSGPEPSEEMGVSDREPGAAVRHAGGAQLGGTP